MSSDRCPECGRSVRDVNVWKECPKHDGRIVCIECCMSCEHYFKNEAYIAHGCRFGVERWHDQKEDRDKRLKMVDAQIMALYDKQDYYFKNDWPQAARKLEGDISRLKHEKAVLLMG